MVQVLSQRLAAFTRKSSVNAIVDAGLAGVAVCCVGFGLAAILGILR